MKSIREQLSTRLADAFAAVLGVEPADVDAMVRPAGDPKFGHYQSNAAMALAKRAKRNPRQLAEAAVAAAMLDDLALPCEVAGPGFINIRLKPEFLADAVATMAGDDRLAIDKAGQPDSIVIDFSSPNIAKEMHIGHLRSTVLGDVLSRILEFLGHTVHRQNHVGDWGTQFGMLLGYLREKTWNDLAGTGQLDLADIEDFYRQAKKRFDDDPAFAAEARLFVTKLQSGDPEVINYWRRFTNTSLSHCQSMYDRLGVSLKPEHVRGESAYNDDLPKVVGELREKGLLVESDGAQCVFVEGFTNKEGNPRPFIVQKSDGGYLYATTDLAAIRYRVATFDPDRILYVVDVRQAEHFTYLFAVARKAGFVGENVQLSHIGFGTIQGPDGRPFKTKSGESVKLADVLDEAVARARAVVEQKNPELPEAEKAKVAEAVGIGAVKYFDLSNNRLSDYRFDWDQMLALSGNTAPYMQYAYARVRSIFRKGGISEPRPSGGEPGAMPASAVLSQACMQKDAATAPRPPVLAHEKELALALHLARYGETLAQVVEDYRPNILCDYLYNLAIAFSGFYEACPVLKAEEPTRRDRLRLSRLTGSVMKHGLGLLGIDVLEQM